MEKSKTQIHEQKPPRKSKSEQELISAEKTGRTSDL
ncbi:unnamed protein product, partial [Vitis vinifera]